MDPATNRITDPGWEYDPAGNVIEDGGAHHFVWDSVGRLIGMGPPQPSTSGPPGNDGRCTVPPCPPPPPPPPNPPPPLDDGRSSLPSGLKGQSVETVSYEYDYQGRRVVKDEGGTGRLYFWDEVLGEVIWEFPLENPSSQDLVRFFVNGRLVAESDARPGTGFHFMHRDHLGTSKLMTDFFSATVVCDEVYHPFGRLQSGQPSGCNAHVRKFTEKERDAESEMDYFRARYYDPLSGRFLSPDRSERPAVLPFADARMPQTINRYSYVINNPLRYSDPNGHCGEVVTCTIEFGTIGSAAGPFGTALGVITGVVVGSIILYEGYTALSSRTDDAGDADAPPAGESSEPDQRRAAGKRTPHGQRRADEARSGDARREVGDANRVVREGREFIDTETGNHVFVKGDRVVIRNEMGEEVTRFKNTRANTQARIESGRWVPAPPSGN